MQVHATHSNACSACMCASKSTCKRTHGSRNHVLHAWKGAKTDQLDTEHPVSYAQRIIVNHVSRASNTAMHPHGQPNDRLAIKTVTGHPPCLIRREGFPSAICDALHKVTPRNRVWIGRRGPDINFSKIFYQLI